MSLTYAKLKDKPDKLLAFTSLTRTEFEHLLVVFEQVNRPSPTTTRAGQPRRRQAGGGRKARLAHDADQLLFILFYLKTYPLQEVMAELFDLDVSNVNDWIQRLLPVVRDALDQLAVLPERHGPDLAAQPAPASLVIDGTERRRQRPKNPEKQGLHYSGKKKAHTDKNVLVTEKNSQRVRFLSQTYPGKAHDKKIADHAQLAFAPATQLYQDAGFQGFQPHGVRVRQPKKAARARTDRP